MQAPQQQSAQMTTYDYSTKLATMTPEEKNVYLQKADTIKMGDMSSITQYGSELSSVISRNGDSLLDSVKGNSTNEVTNLVTELLGQLNLIDIDELNVNKGWRGFLRKIPFMKRVVMSVEQIQQKYNTISENVQQISNKMSKAKIVALRDNSTLDTIYNNNKNYISQIRELIIAAKIKDEEVGKEIEMMQENPDQYEAYHVNDMIHFRTALQKRITDLVTHEYTLYQNLYQIRAIQSNNSAIADKSDSIINHVFPIWKSNLAISIVMNNQKASIEAQRLISDTTQTILKKNADMLKMNSISVAKATEEAVISLDTLREVTNKLYETVTEVKRIHAEGAKERENVEKTLMEFRNKFENELISE